MLDGSTRLLMLIFIAAVSTSAFGAVNGLDRISDGSGDDVDPELLAKALNSIEKSPDAVFSKIHRGRGGVICGQITRKQSHSAPFFFDYVGGRGMVEPSPAQEAYLVWLRQFPLLCQEKPN